MFQTGAIPGCSGFSCEVAVSGIWCLEQEQDGSEAEPSVPAGGCSRAHLVLFQVNEAPTSEVKHLVCAPALFSVGFVYPDLTLPQKAPFLWV